MSEILNKFNIFRYLPPNLVQNIKSFYISRFKFGYCVTNDNKVFGFGEGVHEILGYNKSDEKYVLIKELCQQNIQEFYEGNDVMFAKNEKNQIFSWGQNYHGELAREYESEDEEYLKPEMISFFDGKNIIQISCGLHRCSALSADGLLYGWGRIEGDLIIFPKFLTEIDLGNIKRVFYSVNSQFVVQTFDEILYDILWDFNKLKEMKDKKIIDLYVDSYYELICQTEDWVYICKKSKVEKTSYTTLFEYFLFEEQMTYKTIHLKYYQLFVFDIQSNEQNSKLLVEVFKQIYSNHKSLKQNDMNSSLRNFRISKDLPQILDSNAKYYYQSGWKSPCYFGLFVMNERKSHSFGYENYINESTEITELDDKVYCFGENSFGKLGLGHQKNVYEYTEIIELSEKNIQEFYEGDKCMFARNDKSEIFSWGVNSYGQLARGYKSQVSECLKPEKVSFFDGKNAIQISCGNNHCLALSSDGHIYGWGDNSEGQLGCEIKENSYISTPILINLKEKIKFIYCDENISFSVSFDGNAYYWGNNGFDFPDFTPKLIPLKNLAKIYYNHDYFVNEYMGNIRIMDNDGELFKFNIFEKIIEKINSKEKFCDLFYQELYDHDISYFLLQSEDCVYKLENDKFIKTDFINFFDFCSQNSINYNKTIEISKDGYLMEKQIQFNEKEKILISENKYIFERKYENMFEEIKEKGNGSYGTVYEVEKKLNQFHYAIKMAEITNELDLSEIKIMSELNTNFVVQYIDSWIEVKVLFKKLKRYLFIQMELCEHNLREVIQLMKEISDEKFQIFNYFISCKIFKELIECLEYLHSIPIIHRDLKPENILISEGINERSLKLCDFGFAKFHEKSVHTRMVGTDSYMAPEVRDGINYNTKSDIYSLALIATEIFQFEDSVRIIRNHKTRDEFDNYSLKYLNINLENKFRILLDLISNCLLQEDYHSRPDCEEFLEKFNKFSIDKSVVLNDENIIDFYSYLENKNYLKKFFETKIDAKKLYNLVQIA